MATEANKKVKRVYVTGYPNIAPAGIAITQFGEATKLPVAIGRAVDAIFKDKRLKGKRIVLPMRLVVTGGADEE